MITDLQLIEFLRRLVLDQRGKNSLNLTDWEAQFLGSFSMAERQSLWLTGDFNRGRRASVDRLWRRYGMQLNFPHPLDRATQRAAIPDAVPGGCQYLVKLDGPQQPCNEPATCREPGRLRYCAAHGQMVEQAHKRRGKTVALVNL